MAEKIDTTYIYSRRQKVMSVEHYILTLILLTVVLVGIS